MSTECDTENNFHQSIRMNFAHMFLAAIRTNAYTNLLVNFHVRHVYNNTSLRFVFFLLKDLMD